MLTKQDLDALVTLSYAEIGIDWLDDLIAVYQAQVGQRLNYYRWFYHYVRRYQPQVCLELGVEFGLGSAHMCAAAKEYGGVVIGIDHNRHEVAADLLPKEYDRYYFINGDTQASVRTLLAVLHHAHLRTPVTGLIFQDSSHHYVPSKREWDGYSRFFSKGSLWCCDDITPAFHDPKIDPVGCSMVTYFEGLPGEKYLFPDVLHKGNTIGMVIL